MRTLLFVLAAAWPSAATAQRPEPAARELRMAIEQARGLAARTAGSADLRVALEALRQQHAEIRAGAETERLADLAMSLAEGRARLERTAESFATEPPAAGNRQDPADSIYREARSALNRSNYSKAAFLFARIHEEYPKSTYAGDAYYWEAMAHYRTGSRTSLERARDALDDQRSDFPNARTRNDAADLLARIDAELARRGDAGASERVREIAERAAEVESRADRVSAATRDRARAQQARTRCTSDDDDEKSAALMAFLNMDADRALPVLEKVMARRDAGSECLRRKAVFIVSQKQGPQSEAILLRAAASDPDPEVKEQAVFWLGQAGGERAAVALDSILRRSSDRTLQDKAIFSLSQNRSARAQSALRDYAMRTDAPADLRGNAIFWLGQSGDNAEYLRSIYRTVDTKELKEKIIFSVAQNGSADAGRWLTDIARDRGESTDIRKTAVFWLGQSRSASVADLASIYGTLGDREIKESLIFALSQRKDKAAVDKLIDIARSETDRDLRKKALFWLSQTNDPRVAAIYEEILTKP
ncbi:MAG: HEAT repeat domain-containing protein [Gemmatimonadales bacterium]